MIIGLSGHIKSGKSTAATIIKNNFPFEEKYFAFKLKYIASILTGDDIKLFETQEGKEGHLDAWGMTRRKILQIIGTEALRNHFDPNVWIKALFADYKLKFNGGGLSDSDLTESYPNWVISDVRFKNEADAIKAQGGYIIRINRPFSNIYPEMWAEYLASKAYVAQRISDPYFSEPNEDDFIVWLTIKGGDHHDLHAKISHLSETELDNYTGFDLIVNNTSTVTHLQSEIKNFITQTCNINSYI